MKKRTVAACLVGILLLSPGCYDLMIAGSADDPFVSSLDLRHDFEVERMVYRRVSLFRSEPSHKRKEPWSFRVGAAGLRGPATATVDGVVQGRPEQVAVGYPVEVHEEVRGDLQAWIFRMGVEQRCVAGDGLSEGAFFVGLGIVSERFSYGLDGVEHSEDCGSGGLDVGLALRIGLAPTIRLVWEAHAQIALSLEREPDLGFSGDARAVVEWEMGRGTSLVAGWRWMRLWADGSYEDTDYAEERVVDMTFAISGPTAGLAFRF